MPLERTYTSIACAKYPQSLDWDVTSNKLFYAGSNSLVVYDFEADDKRGSVLTASTAHNDKITSVRCCQGFVLTTSRDSTAILWSWDDIGLSLKKNAVFDGQGAAVMTGDLMVEEDLIWVAAGGADDQVVVYTVTNNLRDCTEEAQAEPPTKIQSLTEGTETPLCIRIFRSPQGDVILFVGWTNCKVALYSWSKEQSLFVSACVLCGHEDWVRGIDAVAEDTGDVLVASCSQDSLIRMWRISMFKEEEDLELSVKKIEFHVNDTHYQVQLETVLQGHDNWVYSVRWNPSSSSGTLELLSASIDKSIIIWRPSSACDIWMDSVRVGEVGGNNLGFYGAVWGPDGLAILGHGFHGSFHLWRRDQGKEDWQPCVVPGGHFNQVTDICWSPGGNYLLSCSSDQTTRLHAAWKGCNFKEIGRPQVHGHDLFTISTLSEHSFVSGAEEKVLRAFSATKNFMSNYSKICGKELATEEELKALPEGASVAALGLSNKAVYEADLKAAGDQAEGQKHPKDTFDDFYFSPIVLDVPPTEETLAQNTLWTETKKLYGHGYELYTIAASHSGGLLASACKAQSAKHAAIILWDTKSWNILQHLEHHTLTVTQIAFSPDDSMILTVSRDRTWALFEKVDGGEYKKVASCDKTCSVHQRIMWSCAFSHCGRFFATVSRDKKLVVWTKDSTKTHSLLGSWTAAVVVGDLRDSATSVAFAPGLHFECLVLAVGLDNGEVWTFKLNSSTAQVLHRSQIPDCHHQTVNRLAFRPNASDRPEDKLLLASCSNDNFVKIYTL